MAKSIFLTFRKQEAALSQPNTVSIPGTVFLLYAIGV